MNKFKKIILTTAFAVTALATTVLGAACGGQDVKKYSLSFETNGSSAIQAESVAEGNKYTLPTPTREGYEFVGWYGSADFSGSPITEITVTADAKFYAKWIKLYTITLDADGGALSASSLTIKEGENLFGAVKDYAPTKANLTFGAWFKGNEPLSETAVADSDITLTAKYKVAYTVAIYVPTKDGSDYELLKTENGTDYVGATYSGKIELEGYEEVENPNARPSGVLSENASENAFSRYFNVKQVTSTFVVTNPVSGEEEQRKEIVAAAYEEVELPSEYEVSGYCLVGWATEKGGKVAVYANYIFDRLYNKAEGETRNSFAPTANATYYSVWAAAYTDMFGGADKVYLLGQKKEVYVERNGVFFRAEYNSKAGTFSLIHDVEDKTLVKGKLNDDMTFVYSDKSRASETAYSYTIAGGVNKNNVIFFDEYNGITFVEYDENNKEKSRSTGYYSFTNGNQYVAVFEEGDKEGQIINFIKGKVTVSNEPENVFQVRDEEDIAMGDILRAYLNKGSLLVMRKEYYGLKLNGFGIATLAAYDQNGNRQDVNYFYTFNEDRTVLTLRTQSMQNAGVVKIFTYGGNLVYTIYDQAYDKTITVGNQTLVTDGTFKAQYSDGTNTYDGYFSISDSVFGYIVDFYGDSSAIEQPVRYRFLVTSSTREVEGEDGNTKVETYYTFENKDAEYVEYYYSASDGIYRAPLLVIENASGAATFYGYTANKTYEPVSSGTVTKGVSAGSYRYTATKSYADKFSSIEEDRDEDGNLLGYAYYVTDENGEKKLWMYPVVNVAYLEYADVMVDTENAQYKVNYWSSYKLEGGEVETLTKIYDDGEARLTVWGGFARYVKGEVNEYGIFSKGKDGYSTLAIKKANENTGRYETTYLYFELDEENNSFVLLAFEPFTATEMLSDGKAAKNSTISLDGKGGATLTYLSGEGEEAEVKLLVGTVDTTGEKSVFGSEIYRFRSGDTTFEFVCLVVSDKNYFARRNGEIKGEYTDGSTKLLVDGFGYQATYTDADGKVIEGNYYIGDDGEIVFVAEDGYRYFDLKGGNAYTKRGDEYGGYVVLNNRTNGGMAIFLDGYGKLTVSVTVYNEETKQYETNDVATDVEYVLKDGYCTFTYSTSAGGSVTMKGQFGYVTSNNSVYKAFFAKNEDVVMNYVNTSDWSVLSLDGYGNAVKIDKDGAKEKGIYMLITDNLLYYATDEDASIYKYDVNTGVVAPVENKACGYYTKTLESLVFTKYGFAVFNGTTRYYYNVVDGICYIYHQEFNEEGLIPQETNKYGFIEEEFGPFTEQKEYNGKTYYYDEGDSLLFERGQEKANDYVIKVNNGTEVESCHIGQLSFKPSGAEQFAVYGKIMLGDNRVDCIVYRVGEGEDVEMFVVLQLNAIAYYRLDITVDYKGGSAGTGDDGNTYEITSMKRIESVKAYNYWYLYYYYSMYFGEAAAKQMPNVVGYVQFVHEYDVEGNETVNYMTGEFGPASGAYDINGNIIVYDKAQFEQVDEKGQNFIATFKVKNAEDEENPDNYTYKMYLSIQYISALRTYGYVIAALTREQTLSVGNGYNVVVERVITSDAGYETGYLFGARIYNGDVAEENEIEYSVRFNKDNVWYLLAREQDENGKFTASKYYKLTLVDSDVIGDDLTDVSEEELEKKKKIVPTYESASMTIADGSVVYAENGTDFVDLDENGQPVLITLAGKTYLVTECSADPENPNKFFVTVNGVKKYTIELKDGENGRTAEIAEVVDTAE